ncbi:hypothetical protein GCM10028803_40640 [Larkinella knui]
MTGCMMTYLGHFNFDDQKGNGNGKDRIAEKDDPLKGQSIRPLMDLG